MVVIAVSGLNRGIQAPSDEMCRICQIGNIGLSQLGEIGRHTFIERDSHSDRRSTKVRSRKKNTEGIEERDIAGGVEIALASPAIAWDGRNPRGGRQMSFLIGIGELMKENLQTRPQIKRCFACDFSGKSMLFPSLHQPQSRCSCLVLSIVSSFLKATFVLGSLQRSVGSTGMDSSTKMQASRIAE